MNIPSKRSVYSEVSRPDYFRKNHTAELKTEGRYKQGEVLFSMIESSQFHGILWAIITNTAHHLDTEVCEPLGCSVAALCQIKRKQFYTLAIIFVNTFSSRGKIILIKKLLYALQNGRAKGYLFQGKNRGVDLRADSGTGLDPSLFKLSFCKLSASLEQNGPPSVPNGMLDVSPGLKKSQLHKQKLGVFLCNKTNVFINNNNFHAIWRQLICKPFVSICKLFALKTQW